MTLPLILLIGKMGQVGWELRRTLAPFARVIAVDYPEIDLANPASIRHWVDQTRPQLIVNAAAYTAVDKAESEFDSALQINGTAPGILAEEAKKANALLVHFSTDYVFDGSKSEPYVETDAPHPLSAYGRSKLAGDQAIQATGVSHLIFRLCWVYGARGQNFMLTMMRLAREREILRVVNDQLGCPTSSRMIAQATTLACRQVVSTSDWSAYTGIYNLACSGHTTWHGFAEAIVKRMSAQDRKCNRVDPIPTSQYPLPAKRPAYSVLNCDKLESTFGLKLPSWDDALNLVLEN
jgi:dTDP-4-dehydrorhamnose reductase